MYNIFLFLYLFKYYSNMKWIIDTDYSSNSQELIKFLLKNKLDIIAITLSSLHGLDHLYSIKTTVENDLKKNNMHIPVFAGASQSYINFQKELNDVKLENPYSLDAYTIEVIKHDKEINVDESAAVNIINLIKTHKKDLNILCLSQLTNLSLSILIDSSIKDEFNCLYLIGGSTTGQSNSGIASESNFRNDPIAAKNVILYYKNVLLIPIELEQYSKDISNFNSLSNYVLNMRKENKSIIQIIAGLLIINEKIIKKIIELPGDVDTTGRYTRGALSLEKYPWIESGLYNKIRIVEEISIEELSLSIDLL